MNEGEEAMETIGRVRVLVLEIAAFAAAAALPLLLVATPAAAQIPDTFTNLQVLPSDIPRSELVGLMRSFSFALGARCSKCHAVTDALGDPSDDFTSDVKPAKNQARAMLRMVNDINEEFLAALPARREPHVTVTCMTCHRGVSRPEALEDLLLRVTTQDGIDAALQRYAALRDRYYGRATYDFGPRPLFTLGEKLVAAGRPAEATQVFRRILDDVPESTEAWLNIGAAEAAAGNREAAIAAYRRVIEIDPGGGWAATAARRIAELGGGA